MECLGKCDYLVFEDGSFYCGYYDKTLQSHRNEMGKVIVERYNLCETEGIIGSNNIEEKVNKLKRHIGWLMDFFYSFKDDMESEVSDIYRVLKELEDEAAGFQETKSD